MGYWDNHKGTLRDYHRDPFPHSLLRASEKRVLGGSWREPVDNPSKTPRRPLSDSRGSPGDRRARSCDQLPNPTWKRIAIRDLGLTWTPKSM